VSDWFSDTMVTEPPRVELLSTEQRNIAVGLAPMLVSGDVVDANSVTADVVEWGTRNPVSPSPIVGTAGYNASTKTAAVVVDGSKMPVRRRAALRITFNVTGSAGAETRSSYVILDVKI